MDSLKYVNNLKDTIAELIKDENFFDEIDYTNKILSLNYTDIEAHWILSLLYETTYHESLYQKHKSIYENLLKSILSSGDRKKCKTGWRIVMFPEAYFVLNILNAKQIDRVLVKRNKSFCDRWIVGINGKKRILYFNVDEAFRGYSRIPSIM